MKAGKLDRLITIERATQVTDPLGGVELTWAPLVTVWAEKKDLSDYERVRASELGASITTRFTIRHDVDVRVQDRVVYGGRTYDLAAVRELGRQEGLELSGNARAE